MREPEKWMELCELAAKEQDPNKLLKLTEEINRLLREKEKRLEAERGHGRDDLG